MQQSLIESVQVLDMITTIQSILGTNTTSRLKSEDEI